MKKHTKYSILLLFAVAIVFSACKSGDYKTFSPKQAEPASLEAVYLGGDYLLASDRIVVKDDLLINVNPKSKQALFDVFNLNNLSYLGACGIIGGGPNEFQFVNTKCFGANQKDLYIMEATCCSTFEIIRTEDDSVRLTKTRVMHLPTNAQIPNSLLILNDSTLLTYINNENFGEFYTVNAQRREMKPISKYPSLHKPSDMPSGALSSVYLNKLFMNEKTNQVATVYSYFPMVKVFSPEMECTSMSLLNNWEDQAFEYKDGGVSIGESYMYYLDACASSDYIIGLYIGKKTSELGQLDPKDFRPELHIWDWNGQPVKNLKLDKFINKIAVSETNKLYGASFLTADSVYIYQIQ